PAAFDTVAIAPLDQALTFARDERRRVLAVTAYAGGMVQAVELDADDPITLVRAQGYDRVADVVRAGTPRAIPAATLMAPVDLGDHHVAAATNFPEHAGDAGVKDGPFLFPKLVRPTGPRAPIPAGQALL